MGDLSLRFDPEGHTYYLGMRRLPSVTQALAQFHDLSQIDPDVLEAARRRGVHVHRMVELAARGELDEESVHQAYQGYLKQWRAFLAATRFRPLFSEMRCYDQERGYAGTLDLIGILGRRLSLIDIKTGVLPKTVAMQTAAYLNAGWKQRAIPFHADRAALLLHADSYRFVPIDSDVREDFEDFAAALRTHKWRIRNA